MRKFILKAKKVIVAVILAIISFPNKIFAINPSSLYIQDLYGPPPVALYGVTRPSTVTLIWRIARTFIIPIALLIGLIIYFKKSKSSKKKKILVTIGIIAITAIVYFVINKIMYELV